ncbi:MAG: hypothetical protein ACOYOK_10640 [Pseudobdellovibrionaceae bacterium]
MIKKILSTKFGLLCFYFLVHSLSSRAETIYTCKEEKSATIAWEYGGIFSKQGLVAEAKDSRAPTVISFVVSAKKVLLKGNLGQVELKKISESVFTEESISGNIFLWTILPAENSIPTYIIQHKAYKLGGPFSIMVAYKCQ